MPLFDAFDAGFDNADVSASMSRKGDDGKTRTAKLVGAVPTGMTVEEFAEAAEHGLKRGMGCTDRGVKLVKSAPVLSGAAARRAVLSLADPVPTAKPDAVPDKVRNRGRILPSENGAAPANGAAK